MTLLQEAHQIVGATVELTGAASPEILDEASPALSESVLASAEARPFYLVGLIGGKNVGKSSLVNALVGDEITARSSVGPGTEQVVAYVHESRVESVKDMLEREVPGRYEIVSHGNRELARQVLLDLPDIDSYFEFHRDVTSRMLRHMLFPVWLQSVEKYADHRSNELLARVAAGNDPRNFVFCVNKIDQIIRREGETAARELCDEYASRLAAALGIDPPKVWMVSALEPGTGEFPALRNVLARQKSVDDVSESQQRAARRHVGSLLTWVSGQKLDERLQRLRRLLHEAEAEVMERVGGPLLERVAGPVMDDPALCLALADEAMQHRVARWPIVNILHVLLDPVTSMLRYRLSIAEQRALESPEGLVERHLGGLSPPLSMQLQVTFARLQQSHPEVSQLYREHALWEPASAERAERELRDRLSGAVERQQAVLRSEMAAGGGAAGRLGRWALTLGAVVWFPIAQPILETWLAPGGISDLALLVVRVLGVTYLLENVAFLAVYFVFLWLCLKWASRRDVSRGLARFKRDSGVDADLSLWAQTLEWLSGLVAPIRQAGERTECLLRRASELESRLVSGRDLATSGHSDRPADR